MVRIVRAAAEIELKTYSALIKLKKNIYLMDQYKGPKNCWFKTKLLFLKLRYSVKSMFALIFPALTNFYFLKTFTLHSSE